MKTDKLEIENYFLTSSTEVDKFISELNVITYGNFENILIHIESYMHNTVLVQNLKSKLHHKLPKAKISLLKCDDKSKTIVRIYTYHAPLEDAELSDEILKELSGILSVKSIDIKKCKKDLINKYFSDNLTHLPNIYQLRKDLYEDEHAGLIVLNIDNFKTINNFYGFSIGDFVIEQVAQHLKELLHEYKLFRISIDEFAIILNPSLGFYDLKDLLTSLYNLLNNLFIEYQENKIFINFTLASCANIDNKDIFSKVSMALKYAKQKSLPFWIYEDRMHFENEYENNLKISTIIRYAIENLKIVPYFQPIIDNKTSKITKYESLARLIDENSNIISPTLFIPIAKQIKVYNLVTMTIIEKSFEIFKDNSYELNINLSIEDIMSSEIFEFIIQKLKNNPISNRVTFELLESEAIKDFKKVERFINEVKRYGSKIAIDDFGSGYSNFSYLTKMRVDYIKIDGSLIKDIDTDKSALLVVETIVDFAKKLGIKSVAEFVHSSTIMDKVKELGIDYSQGFYIDEPLVELK